MKTYKVPMNVEIDQDTLDGIIDSAIRFSTYWREKVSVVKEPEDKPDYISEYITRGGELGFKIDEPFVEGGDTFFVLTLEKTLKALGEFGVTDFSDFDGPMSDSVLQLALFGEVIYG